MLSQLLHGAACSLFVALYLDHLLLDVISTAAGWLLAAVSTPSSGLSAVWCYILLFQLLHSAACTMFVALYSDLLLLDVISTAAGWLKAAVSTQLFWLSAVWCCILLSQLLHGSACSLFVALYLDLLLLDVISTAAGLLWTAVFTSISVLHTVWGYILLS